MSSAGCAFYLYLSVHMMELVVDIVFEVETELEVDSVQYWVFEPDLETVLRVDSLQLDLEFDLETVDLSEVATDSVQHSVVLNSVAADLPLAVVHHPIDFDSLHFVVVYNFDEEQTDC